MTFSLVGFKYVFFWLGNFDMKASCLIAVPMHPTHKFTSNLYHNADAGFFLVFPCFSRARWRKNRSIFKRNRLLVIE